MLYRSLGFLRSVCPPGGVNDACRSTWSRKERVLHSRDDGMVSLVCLALLLPPFHSGVGFIVIGAVGTVGCLAVGAEKRPSYIVVGEGK